MTVMEPFGWKSNDQLRKALSELMHYGFLVKTRQGGRNLCSLYYALGWYAIDHCKGKHDAMETPPPDFWKKQIELFDASKYLGRGAVFGKADKRT